MKKSRIKLTTGLLSVATLMVTLWLISPGIYQSSPISPPARIPDAQNGSDRGVAVTPHASRPQKPVQPPSGVAQEAGFRMAFKARIDFYGRVIDQHAHPVSGADVKLSANDKAFLGQPSHYTRKSDDAGEFSIEGISGLTLGGEVSKPGYRIIPPAYGKVTSSGVFEFGLSSRGPHQSSKNSPTVFTLHKVGPLEPLVKVGGKNFRLARDGKPLSVAVDKEGNHRIVLRCWTQEQRALGQRQYDWKLELDVPGGGLLVRKDHLTFLAPQQGYAPSDTIDMPASLGDKWRSFAERSYFIRFADETFARANIEMRSGGDHFLVWESFYNAKPGSRNLESAAD